MTPRTSAPASDNQGQTQSLEARVGQLFVVLLDPNRPPHQAVRWHGEHYFGGFFLRSENMPTIGQTRALSRLFRGYGRGFPPAMIAIDEEGGLVSHTSKITTSAPSAMALGVVDDADVTGDVYEGIGTKLRSLGVNTVFAPVADIHSEPANPVIGTRAFGTTARSVTKHAGAAIKGLRRAGVASTLKHFPGHGGTTQDSHFTLPTVDGSKDQLTDRELSPFISLIEDEKPELVMVGHVAYPGLDSSGKPASLSRLILTDLLRTELDFNGLIITDSLDMEAVKKDGPEVAVQALKAGCDLLLFGQDLEFAVQCYQVVLEAFRSKKLSEERLVESLERIHKLRDSFRARTWIRNEDAYDNLQITEEALF
ncbi:MAG: glycoside hydrolase family 3 protein, partial [Candidatus Eisenbacteria bacterium]|nr:glycoside hydrolase family 3 protein [Candidatus Eisenbacteria bacterium]